MSCNAEPDLVVVVLCDPPGHGSSSTQCGGNDFLEPLVLTQNDSWTAQYSTQYFAYNKATRTLTLKKSGHCVGSTTEAANAPIGLSTCSGSTAPQWLAHPSGTYELLSATTRSPTGMCIGASASGGSVAGDKVFTVDSPFAMLLDTTSKITILPFQGHIAFNGNDYSDGGEGTTA
jgi:hypothetical protein